MYKKLIQMIIDANSIDEYNDVIDAIAKAFENDKISWKDHEQLYGILNKFEF